ncbi:MAG: Uncharacterized protein XE11_1575 [Methanomicrobiales archaeon 53_19]|uniref:hypothetical protein n=1 Tax=Methanocalculus sp. TaxID=2004547 RepID=UPI000745F9CF|nr:hypothetical protein [Methanocalculus sp.]KUL02905.1 MAG: Uncharacterized protein XE11_1575 [Methanomicrobiales archaeon 53_19]HIJ06454.1 hypothetical protein [Methanocalculus sp.]
MRDDSAVAPVVAMILILAIVVTLLSAFQVTVVPAMKERSEMEHIAGVEMALLRFSSHIEAAAAMKQPLSFSETVQLGGGDTMLNSIRSGGTLHVMNENRSYPVAGVSIQYEDSGGGNANITSMVHLINVSYSTVGNFWRDQEYHWRWGIMFVHSGSRETPLQYPTMNEANESILDSGFPGSLLTIQTDERLIPERFENGTITGNLTQKVTIRIERVSFSKGSQNFVSGNANAKIALSTARSETIVGNATGLEFRVSTQERIPESFRESLNRSLGHSLSAFISKTGIPVLFENNENRIWRIDTSEMDLLPDIILREIDITVTAG